ncbi:SDR family NAD(P)-dependent oxidoreductase [Kitasatospora sp. NPDC004745]|uniref:SDR family NAD(P)-dependent oxidoreductase n=1 Tax=Kitasatospora sp. NPDC004745 TaxID=3364019 RepID=UPI0036869CCE
MVTARDPRQVAEAVRGHGERALALPLDVTAPGQIATAVARAQAAFGRIDVLVNNAGYGYLAAVEEGEDEEVRALFDTDVFGVVDTTRAVLPGMRARRAGHIVNISSLGGLVGFGATGYYHATKFAVEGLSEALVAEVAPPGHQGDDRRARRVPHRLVRAVDAPVRHRHRRLRPHRGRAARRHPGHPRSPAPGIRPVPPGRSSTRSRPNSHRCACCWARPPTTSPPPSSTRSGPLRRLAGGHSQHRLPRGAGRELTACGTGPGCRLSDPPPDRRARADPGRGEQARPTSKLSVTVDRRRAARGG